MKTKSAFAAILVGLTCIHLPRASGQGEITPPPGPPTPTMKTLDQVEARIIVNATNTPGDAANTFIITAPGSYYLIGNLDGAPGMHGISIQADDVTLDLNGFALIGGGGGACKGVNVPGVQSNFCIRNGSVRGWTDGGVRAELARNTLAEKLRLANNTGATGLSVGLGSMIKDCVAMENGVGFQTTDRCHLANCISTTNTGDGYSCGSYVSVIDCTASRNARFGFLTQGSCNLVRCSATRSDENGFTTGTGCTFGECTAASNVFNGFSITAGTSIHNCTAQGNGLSGILATGNCHIFLNICDANSTQGNATSAGIRADGANRIDTNHCTNNGSHGFFIEGPGFLTRNFASGQTLNYNVGPTSNVSNQGTVTSPWTNWEQ